MFVIYGTKVYSIIIKNTIIQMAFVPVKVSILKPILAVLLKIQAAIMGKKLLKTVVSANDILITTLNLLFDSKKLFSSRLDENQ